MRTNLSYDANHRLTAGRQVIWSVSLLLVGGWGQIANISKSGDKSSMEKNDVCIDSILNEYLRESYSSMYTQQKHHMSCI